MYALATLSILAGGVLAQTTSITTFLNLDFDNNPVASVVDADSTATTYALNCNEEDIDDGECGIFPYMTLTVGPSTYAYTYTDNSDGEDFTVSMDCQVTGTTEAYCTASFGGADANDPGVTSAALTGDELTFSPLTITAGLDKLAAATGAAASTTAAASSTDTAQSGSQASSGASKTASAASSTITSTTKSATKSGSSTGSAATAASTGAAAYLAVPIAAVAGVAAAAFAL